MFFLSLLLFFKLFQVTFLKLQKGKYKTGTSKLNFTLMSLRKCPICPTKRSLVKEVWIECPWAFLQILDFCTENPSKFNTKSDHHPPNYSKSFLPNFLIWCFDNTSFVQEFPTKFVVIWVEMNKSLVGWIHSSVAFLFELSLLWNLLIKRILGIISRVPQIIFQATHLYPGSVQRIHHP